jgi:signal transduction histidine kinase
LAICREIMSRLGGSISYLDDVEGTGFRVTLPNAMAIAAQ